MRSLLADRDVFDVAVVGGGLVGASLAYELVCGGARVVLVDRGDPGRASDAGAGILSAETTQSNDADWFELARASSSHYVELVARLEEDGAGDFGYEVCGLVSVAVREGDDEWFERAADLAARRSGEVVREIDPPEAARMFPPLGTVRRALHNPRAARVDGMRLSRALRRSAERRGLAVRGSGVRRLLLRDGRVTAVETDDGSLACGAVVIAGGAWSKDFGSQLGARIPVEPCKGQIAHLQLPGTDSARWPIVQPVLSHYLVPWPGGRVAVGGTFEPRAGFDARPTAAGIHELLRECLVVAPGMAQATFLEVRVGLRPMASDDSPVLGLVPGWENAYLATGHGANGLLLGPYSAKLVADLVLGEGGLRELLAPFSAGRF